MKTVRFDFYVLDGLMPDLVGHDKQPSAFIVYLYLWTKLASPVHAISERVIRRSQMKRTIQERCSGGNEEPDSQKAGGLNWSPDSYSAIHRIATLAEGQGRDEAPLAKKGNICIDSGV
jgi:hypothetical protein